MSQRSTQPDFHQNGVGVIPFLIHLVPFSYHLEIFRLGVFRRGINSCRHRSPPKLGGEIQVCDEHKVFFPMFNGCRYIVYQLYATRALIEVEPTLIIFLFLDCVEAPEKIHGRDDVQMMAY